MQESYDHLFHQGLKYLSQGNSEQAIIWLAKFLQNEPINFEANFYLGIAYAENKNYKKSIEVLLKASVLGGGCEVFINLGICHQKIGQLSEALSYFDKAIGANPLNSSAWLNRGNALQDLYCLNDAIVSYKEAVKLSPTCDDAFVCMGNCYFKASLYSNALMSYEKALSLNCSAGDTWFFKALALEEIREDEKALIAYKKSFQLSQNTPYLLGALLHAQRKVCSWEYLEKNQINLEQNIKKGEKVIFPFNFLGMSDSPRLLKMTSDIFSQDKYPSNPILGPIPKHSKKMKIRIGYFSADFRSHPISFLTAGLFELHNRNHFEIYAFSLHAANPGDPMRARLFKGFDHFIDVQNKSDLEVAQLARDLEIDIAVDLGGHTQHGRVGIFSYRAASIQMSYIGYLGTMGAPYYDYLVADQTIIPTSQQSSYREKIIYLPSFQANDFRRQISPRVFTRGDLGLPDEGFVYCCFNNSYKITPAIFDSWAKILLSVEGSILLLYADNEEVKTNLSREIEVRGVSSQRLIFAGRLSREEYLSRYRAADLFLDTSPYNSGTTASDALWAGLPVLTFLGRSFSARMCGSLLNAIGLPELVASSQQEYEELAISIGKDSEMISKLKNKLTENRLVMPLFDTKLFTQNLEIAYTKAYERSQLGLLPDHIY